MEENSEKNVSNESDFEDFKDFDEGDIVPPEVEEEEIGENASEEHEQHLLNEAEKVAQMAREAGIKAEDFNEGTAEQTTEQTAETAPEEAEASEEKTEENREESTKENREEADEQQEFQQPELPPEPNQWEELDDDNAVVKKYIFYVSKDFVPLMDSMTPDERTGYINDAIQRKVDSEYEYSAIDRKKRILTHIITMVLTFFIVTPIILFLVHKSIMITFDNYKYSQDNFEKLYKERFKNDRAFMRAIEHNKLHEKNNQRK